MSNPLIKSPEEITSEVEAALEGIIRQLSRAPGQWLDRLRAAKVELQRREKEAEAEDAKVLEEIDFGKDKS